MRASGEVSLCPLADAGDGYGNVHERAPTDVLNHLQDAFVYQLHAENRFVRYRQFVDETLFGKEVLHPCTLRAVVTMIAKAMHEGGISPGDLDGIRRANRDVARRAGFLPRREGAT